MANRSHRPSARVRSSSRGAPSGRSRTRPSDPRIPDKHYFRIGEVAALCEVEPYVLRFWETEFPTLRPEKSRGNQRIYSRADVAHVLTIRDLLYEEGFTIDGAKRRIHQRQRGAMATASSARTRATLAQVRSEAEKLLRLCEE